MVTIDNFDAKILKLIQRDASLPLEEIGTAVGLSRNAVWRRVKTLEASGVIRSRVALLDPDKLGIGLTVFMQIRTDRHAADWLLRFAKATRDLPEILGAYRMSGDLDYLIRARVSDVKAYDRLYQELTRRIELADVSASFVMEEIKETTELPVSS
ncbi:DNA-binding transcriptional activator DecR [Defluviimonas aquaemixtae]|uniref:DNA-binding transcriptional activator DecR n=1 Tax=Albidovulum aquaemixtae TaxID=1542388 RepID=A0A2R8B588_9RHOB|nr:Lrp/AsnC family transcriptional regulator [Defluviimonas aquaemixtae]SPH17769.1 DNA-binding transcriptional activator DecR [Defluviimonas aquaemixtae]